MTPGKAFPDPLGGELRFGSDLLEALSLALPCPLGFGTFPSQCTMSAARTFINRIGIHNFRGQPERDRRGQMQHFCIVAAFKSPKPSV